LAQCEATVSGQRGRCFRNPESPPEPARRRNNR
jgi:hypothetical protein